MIRDSRYLQFALVREMMETPAVLRNFGPADWGGAIRGIEETGRLFFTGEGSSRIFPAKNAITCSMNTGLGLHLATEEAYQALEYHLDKFVVFGASNSGQTREVIALFDALKKSGHRHLFCLTANRNSRLASLAGQTFLLRCGRENAVAATKSVAEEALFYQFLLAEIQGRSVADSLAPLADAFEAALSAPVDPAIADSVARAGTIYFAGRNDGVAEELTLKTNEITRKKSDYLEGTYVVHGVEEVMNPDDVVILINPFEAELKKIREVLVRGVGMKVFALAARETMFPTIKIQELGHLSGYVYLAAGWNLLVEVGISLGINLDKPVRARKVGNEFVG